MFARMLLVVCMALDLTACDLNPKSSFGFVLPDGTESKGQVTFVRMGCQSCHTVVSTAE